MSLEDKIEALTLAIECLTIALKVKPEAQESTKSAPAPKKEVTPIAEVTETVTTIESLQALCMLKVRESRDNTAKVKEILNGKLIKQVPISDYQTIKLALELL